MKQEIIVRDMARDAVTIAPSAIAEIKTAVEACLLVDVVGSEFENQLAVDTLGVAQKLIRACESDRKRIKGPVIALGKLIDELAKDATAKLEVEVARISGLAGKWEAAKREAAAAQEAIRAAAAKVEYDRLQAEARKVEENKGLSQIQKEAEATRLEEAQRSVLLQQEIVAPKTESAVVTEKWEFDVLDIHTLYKVRPDLVSLEPKRREINIAISAGREIPGLRVFKSTKVSTR